MTKVLGRLVRDVEVKRFDVNGDERLVLNNAIAIRNRFDKEAPIFLDFTAWGGTAELIAKYLQKGDEALFTGELRNQKSNIEGKTITTVYLRLDKIEFTNGKKKRSEDAGRIEDAGADSQSAGNIVAGGIGGPDGGGTGINGPTSGSTGVNGQSAGSATANPFGEPIYDEAFYEDLEKMLGVYGQ